MATPKILLPYDEAEKFIKEGYILLFRGKTLISRFIQAYGQTEYSHVGIASWANGDKDPVLECLEFRELIGSRAVNLKIYSAQNPAMIDVFSPAYYSTISYYDETSQSIKDKNIRFNGKAITRDMRRHIGQPYSYSQILNMIWYHTPILRFIINAETLNDIINDDSDIKWAVCSSAVAYFYSKHFVDLVKYKSSIYTEPGDLARSPILNYLFTIT